jgi:deazaflavin-dependent oxidoreductase (nitroreductase family)
VTGAVAVDARRRLARYIGAAVAATMAAIYFGIGAGVLDVGGTSADRQFIWVFGALAGAAFLLGAVLLVLFDRRWLWIVGFAFQLFVYWAYVDVSKTRTPPYEMWGITLRIIQVPLVIGLADLAWRAPAPLAVAAGQTASADVRRPLSRGERIGLSLHRGADKWLSPLGVWVMHRTHGAIAGPWRVNALVLTTRGRRSGRQRSVVLQFFPDGEAMVVAAANDGGAAHPGWYYNLATQPEARVEVKGRAIPVHAKQLPAAEARLWWRRIVELSPGYALYERATDRSFPIFRLVPTGTHARAPVGPVDAGSAGRSEQRRHEDERGTDEA